MNEFLNVAVVVSLHMELERLVDTDMRVVAARPAHLQDHSLGNRFRCESSDETYKTPDLVFVALVQSIYK